MGERAAVAVVRCIPRRGCSVSCERRSMRRRHWYFTDPLFLLAAAYNALAGFHLVPMNETVFLEVVAGAAVLAFLPKFFLGRHRERI